MNKILYDDNNALNDEEYDHGDDIVDSEIDPLINRIKNE